MKKKLLFIMLAGVLAFSSMLYAEKAKEDSPVKPEPVHLGKAGLKKYVLTSEVVDSVVVESKILEKVWKISGDESKHFKPYSFFEEPKNMLVGKKVVFKPGKENFRTKGSFRAVKIKADDDIILNPPRKEEKEILYKTKKDREMSVLNIGFYVIHDTVPVTNVEREKKIFLRAMKGVEKKLKPSFLEYRTGEKDGIAFAEMKMAGRGERQMAKAERIYYFSDTLLCKLYVEYRYEKAEYMPKENGWLDFKAYDETLSDPGKAVSSALQILDVVEEAYWKVLSTNGIVSTALEAD